MKQKYLFGFLDMNLQKARDWADFFLKCLSMIAIIAGGAWAYYQFVVTDTTASNIQISVATETKPYSDESRLLLIHAKSKNIGKVLVTPDKEGFVITIRRIPVNAKAGIMELDRLPELYKTDLLKRYPDGYELEPGVEYDDVVAVVVPKGSMYAIDAVLNLGDKTEVDHTTVALVE